MHRHKVLQRPCCQRPALVVAQRHDGIPRNGVQELDLDQRVCPLLAAYLASEGRHLPHAITDVFKQKGMIGIITLQQSVLLHMPFSKQKGVIGFLTLQQSAFFNTPVPHEPCLRQRAAHALALRLGNAVLADRQGVVGRQACDRDARIQVLGVLPRRCDHAVAAADGPVFQRRLFI